MISTAAEEMLELLYLVEVENEPYKPDEDMKAALGECEQLGFVEPAGDRHRLTPAGLDAGRNVVRRHRLAETLLHNVFDERTESVREDGCRFEHVLLHDLEERVCILLGHPSTCPHGKAIPPGDCCRRAETDEIHEVAPLCDGKPGQEGIVSYLSTRDNRQVQKMMALGILPGTQIRLLQRFPSYVFQVGQSQFAVDRPLAEIIYIHWKA